MPSGGVIARWSIPSSRNHSLNGTPRRASSRRSGSTQASFAWNTKTRGLPTLAKCCTFMNLPACGSDECDTAPNISPNAPEKKTSARVKGRKSAGRLPRTIPGRPRRGARSLLSSNRPSCFRFLSRPEPQDWPTRISASCAGRLYRCSNPSSPYVAVAYVAPFRLDSAKIGSSLSRRARAASGNAAAPPSSVMNSRRFTDGRWSHRLFLRFRPVATGPDNFGNGAVRRAEFQRALARFGNDRTAAGPDFRGIAVAIVDFDAPMVDARTGARKLRLFDIFAVVDHQRQIDVSVC